MSTPASAGVLVRGWDRGNPVAFDVTVTLVLFSVTIMKLVQQLGQQPLQLRLGSMLLMTASARWN